MIAPLLVATITSTLSMLAVCAVRRPIRAVFGSRVAYALWWLVPIAILALALPEPPARIATVALRVDAMRAIGPAAIGRTASWHVAWLPVAWLAGALGLALALWRAQVRFERALGGLRRRGRVFVAEHAVVGLPATVGVWRPRVVVPPDFDTAYPRNARALMVLHERAHVCAFDLPANALAALLRCAFWFNPLAHVAWRQFRLDQELACDARLLAAAPRARRLYAETLLGIQLATQRLPIGCHWGDVHPLKERMMMLTVTPPSDRRRHAGLGFVTLFAVGAAAASSALGASHVVERDGQLHVVARIDGGDARDWRGTVNPGTPHHYTWPSDDGHQWTMDLTVRPQGKERYLLDATVSHDGRAPSHPKLVVRDGQPAAMALGVERAGHFEGLQLSVTVTAGKGFDAR